MNLVQPGTQPILHPPIVATRLDIPPARSNLVPRPRLLELLHKGIQGKLSLLCAPAGFGKTTLLSTLCSLTPGLSVSWISLDHSDNDETRFWTCILTALAITLGKTDRTLAQQLADIDRALHAAPQSAFVTSMLSMLINTLAVVPQSCILILDDFHVIETPAIHRDLQFLLDHLPSQLRLIIASRMTPPLSLARLRLDGQLQELRTDQLRFTYDETDVFLNHLLGLALSPQHLTTIVTRTEGWIASLQLAALALQQACNVADTLSTLTGSQRYMFDYLLEEVFHQQSAEIQSFLLQTSLLDRLHADLCNQVTGLSQSHELLAQLERHNLFITPLNAEHSWYRYHPLFAEFLRHHLQQGSIYREELIQQDASRWHEQRGMINEAIRHALAAKNNETVVRLLEEHAQTLRKNRETDLLLSWLDALPKTLLHARPQLCLLYAWAAQFALRFTTVEEYLTLAARQLALHDTGTRILQGELAALSAGMALRRDDMDALRTYAYQALDLLPANEFLFRTQVCSLLLTLYSRYGDSAAANIARQELVRMSQATPDPSAATGILYSLARLQHDHGSLRQAWEIYQQVIHIAEQRQAHAASSNAAGMAAIGLSEILLEWGREEEAERYWEKGMASIQRRSIPDSLIYAYDILACLHRARGDIANALHALGEVEHVLQRYHLSVPPTQHILEAARAYLHLLAGNLDAASRWARCYEPEHANQWLQWRRTELTILIRIHLANHNPRAAMPVVERLLNDASGTPQRATQVGLLLLRAVVLSQQGDEQQALSVIVQALATAEPEGYNTTFALVGSALIPLLTKLLTTSHRHLLKTSHVSTAYVEKVLSACQTYQHRLAQDQERRSQHPKADKGQENLLSKRELDVLRLIATGRSDKEIAQELVLAESTVKTYARRMYPKLGAKNRTEAVAHARELHLL